MHKLALNFIEFNKTFKQFVEFFFLYCILNESHSIFREEVEYNMVLFFIEYMAGINNRMVVIDISWSGYSVFKDNICIFATFILLPIPSPIFIIIATAILSVPFLKSGFHGKALLHTHYIRIKKPVTLGTVACLPVT